LSKREIIVKLSRKWMAAFVAPAVVVGGSLVVALPATAVNLPDLTPKELLMLMDGDVTGFSGTVIKTSDIGLPVMELSSMMSQDDVDRMAERMPEGFEDLVPQLIDQNAFTQLVELAAGKHTMRVYASELGVRVQILDPLSQRDLLLTKDSFWAYDAGKAYALTGNIDQELASSYGASLMQWSTNLATPEEMVDALLAEVGDSSSLRVGADHWVAGRTAYQLVVEPTSEVSLIDSVVISVDSETGLALDLKVYAGSSADVAVSVGFDSISFEIPDSSLFSFTPPPGTTVEVATAPEELLAIARKYQGEEPTEETAEALKADLIELGGSEDLPAASVSGEAWESVAYMESLPADFPTALLDTELFADLMVTVSGGRVFSTPVVNILITDSGEVYAGAVSIDYLVKIAAG
jgi:outer membrane lipoprotein-sorting protein